MPPSALVQLIYVNISDTGLSIVCQLSKNHTQGNAPFELQKLTKKGKLQACHPLYPRLQIPRAKGALDLTAI